MSDDERRLDVTKEKLRGLERLLASRVDDENDPDGFRDLQIEGIQSVIDDLREEISE